MSERPDGVTGQAVMPLLGNDGVPDEGFLF